MKAGEKLGAVAGAAVRHARLTLAICALVVAGAALGVTQLQTDAGTRTLVDADSESFKASERVRQLFGEDPLVIVVRDDLNNLLQTANLGRLLRLEGCLSANPPEGVEPISGPCAELAETQAVKIVTGPATFLNQAVIGIQEQFGAGRKEATAQATAVGRQAAAAAQAGGASPAEAQRIGELAYRQVLSQFTERVADLAVRFGLSSFPSLGDPNFISSVVFDQGKVDGVPKAKLSYLFPNAETAQIVLRLRPDISDEKRERAIDLIAALVADEEPRAECAAERGGDAEPCFKLAGGGEYFISGAPVIVKGLADELRSALVVLLAAAVVLMAVTLFIVFRTRLRLLPLGIALGASGITFGLLGLTGGSLTMASIAVLPVLIGLAVDYAIQLHARFDEEVAAGANGQEAARTAARRAAPVVGTACLATAAGFAVLQLSPTPMVRSFGLLLVVGIAIAFALSMTAGFAALSLRRSRSPNSPAPQRPLPGAKRVSELGRSALAVSIASPGRVLGVALALAACGWIAGTQTKTVSDIRELVPRDLPEVRDLDRLEAATGVSGELDVTVRAPDITDPELIVWMSRFKQRVLEENGFGGPDPECAKAQVCPGPSLTDFLTNPEGGVTQERVRSLIAALPPYDLKGVISTDPRTGDPGNTANIVFGIRTEGLEEQQELIERVRAAIDPPGALGPPEGVQVQLAGLPVLVAESATDISQSRYWLTLAGLLAVAFVLLAIYRSVWRALVPLAPIVLATGWSALILAAMEIPVNPMSAALGALVIAIATEFSVILAARYHEERGTGRSVGEALRRSYERTGAAVLASGLTAIVGFLALTVSDIRMLRDFGVITVVDLGVALLGVMLVLPATLVWAERTGRA